MNITPFAVVAALPRERHRSTIRQLAEWALARGRLCDFDIAAFTLEVLEPRRRGEQLHLTRPGVTELLSYDLRDQASADRTLLPDDRMSHVWTVVSFLAATGRLTDDSEPVEVLLEPFQCFGGLDDEGWPRPDGKDVDFPCQCFHAVDPQCPPGLGLLVVGHHRETYEDYIAYGELFARSADPPASMFDPLFRYAKSALEDDEWAPRLFVDEFTLHARIPASDDHPELWAYSFLPLIRKGYPPLCLDDAGQAWWAKPDRRHRQGYRWATLDRSSAARRAGMTRYELDRQDHLEAVWARQWQDDPVAS